MSVSSVAASSTSSKLLLLSGPFAATQVVYWGICYIPDTQPALKYKNVMHTYSCVFSFINIVSVSLSRTLVIKCLPVLSLLLSARLIGPGQINGPLKTYVVPG